MLIRTFRNSDVPKLADVWMQHWASCTTPPIVTLPMIEQAILSRMFFDASQCLIAENDAQVVGWCQFVADPQTSQTATLCAFCLAPNLDPSAGSELLQAAVQRCTELGFHAMAAGVIRDDRFGYAGLAPMGHGMGIAQCDQRTSSFLQQCGFEVTREATQLVVSTQAYRPPISREALQLRRSTEVSRETPLPDDPRQASAMAHFDIERHHLLDRGGSCLASVDLWCSDPEAEVMSSQHAILDFAPGQSPDQLSPAESFLIGSILQSLASRHIFSVETVVDESRKVLSDQLQTLHFQPQQRGAVWSKTLVEP